MRGHSSFTMSRLNLNLKKIFVEILVSSTGRGQFIFYHVQAKSELKKF